MAFQDYGGATPALRFQRPDGADVGLEELRGERPLALVFLRHFG